MSAPLDIAIVGFGGVFPGATDLSAFWENVRTGTDAAADVPARRWLLEPEQVFTSKVAAPDKVYSRRACLVEDVSFGEEEDLDLEPALLARLDPMFRIALRAARDALDSAKGAAAERDRTGVIFGNIALPTDAASALALETLGRTFQERIGQAGAPAAPGEPLDRFVAGLPAGLVAQALGLRGGSFTLDAACASSFYALKLACDELSAGRADAMLAGGVSRPSTLYTQMGFSQLRALSPTGRCAPFDESADGLVVGEGAGLFLLKRRADAERDGDHIHAVIRGIGLSNDVGGSLMSPDSEGQLRAMRAAYEHAGWSPEDVDLVECHGTAARVGDASELTSLQMLWSEQAPGPERCVIGSVKSNVGHLLTAAGAAGLAKVLLALGAETLPPTANFERSGHAALRAGSFEVLREARPWKRRAAKTPRRAALSAFGFGGINAHVLIEEHLPASSTSATTTSAAPAEPIAIVGMDAHFGAWRDLRTFQERVLGGEPARQTATPTRWWGATESAWFQTRGLRAENFRGHYLEGGALEIPLGRYRIPPKELEEMLPQQLLMLNVMANALEDAGFEREPRLRCGVFVGIALDLNTTNYHFRWSVPEALRDSTLPALTANRTMGALGGIVASRIAREFQVGGPSYTISSEETSGMRALEVAVRALQTRELDSCLVGAVDLAGDIRAVLGTHAVRRYSASGEAAPFDAQADGSIVGEGASALVLKRLADAERDGDRIYAVVRGIGAASGGSAQRPMPTSETYTRALSRAYAEAALDPDLVGYVETHGSGNPTEDRIETEALCSFFAPRSMAPARHLGSVKADIGHAGAAAALASVVKTALCLYQEVIPPVRNLRHVREDLSAEHFLLSTEAQYWLRNRADGPRRAGVSALGVDGGCAHVVLEEHEGSKTAATLVERRQPRGAREEALFAIEGEDLDALEEGLQTLAQHVRRQATPIEQLARSWFASARLHPRAQLGLALVARDRDELLRLIDLAATHVRGEAGDGAQPGSNRILFNPHPLGRRGGLAFVFPGSGNHYLGMGRELAVEWPEVARRQDAENLYLPQQLLPDRFWSAASSKDVGDDHRAFIIAQVALGTVVCDVVRSLGVEPGSVLGYSLGESAGLFALRTWRDREQMLARLMESSLFTDDLAGPCESVRATWGLAEQEGVDWVVGVVDRSAAAVRGVLDGEERVYLLIINTPAECVIGGDRARVTEVVRALRCGFHPLEGVTTVHSPAAQPIAGAYHEFHLFPTTPPEGVRFYSAAAGEAYEVTTESAAKSILEQAVKGFDFPRLIERAYEDGVRIFIEMGPGSSCTRMISRILEGRPHVAQSALSAQKSDVSSLLRLLGRLISERVAVDLEPLYGIETHAVGHRNPVREGTAHLQVPIGGESFHVRPSTLARTLGRTPEPIPERGAAQPSQPEATPVAALPARPSIPAPAAPLPADTAGVPVVAQGAPASFAQGAPAILAQVAAAEAARTAAHASYLTLAQDVETSMLAQTAYQMQLVERYLTAPEGAPLTSPPAALPVTLPATPSTPPTYLDREACLEFAVGSIGKVLGASFAAIDAHPTRVRLPAEPLMLVDRILSVEGEPHSMTGGRVVTEHDVGARPWYLDCGTIPTCIAVESGQADLFLSGWLGIDAITKGQAVYRLLDAVAIFHDHLPEAGRVIRYDIRIERFFRQGDTRLFYFNFEATVDGRPLLSMHEGCAGFFTAAELAAGEGIVRTRIDKKPRPGKRPEDWRGLAPMVRGEAYDNEQIAALVRGDLATCFGETFADLGFTRPETLPGGLLNLAHRVSFLDPTGGRFGLGLIRGEADIHPDDWFLTCHFSDDMVMPGTLMYECCLHTLRIYLLRMGWIGERGHVRYEPIPEVHSRLKCRGQVMADTKGVTYEIEVKELGYGPEPFAIVDALMYADGKAIVEIADMSVRLTGLTRTDVERLWEGRTASLPATWEQILDYTEGRPSQAFGAPYRPFDKERFLAPLPRSPYRFLDRVIRADGEPFQLRAGARATAEYVVPQEAGHTDAWYFEANRQEEMPYAVLLEIALQPCGWLAAYCGSALTSEQDLRFRNLGGRATQLRRVDRNIGTLWTDVVLTDVSHSGGMVIERFRMCVRDEHGPVFEGDTYFGFFSIEALAEQVGIQEAKRYAPTDAESQAALTFDLPTKAPFPDDRFRMVARIDRLVPDGGPHGLGLIEGSIEVDPEMWFFRAHFKGDPVWPGSLGCESFLQILKAFATDRWGSDAETQWQSNALGLEHRWTYRGQVIPTASTVRVEAVITDIDDARQRVVASGFLVVDGRPVYQLDSYSVESHSIESHSREHAGGDA